MSQLQWASVTVGMLVGLGVTRILTCFAAVVRSRGVSRPDWIPLVWAAVIFLMELHMWWGLQDALQAVQTWSFRVFLMFLLSPLLLYFSAVMILPFGELRHGDDYRALFDHHGHWALMSISAYYLDTVCENTLYWGADPLSWWTAIHFTLAALPLVAFFSPRWAHGAIALLFLAVNIVFIFLH